MKTDREIKESMDVLFKISGDKEAIMLAEMREKAMMDEQSRLNGARKEGGIDALKETILDNLSELRNAPQRHHPNCIGEHREYFFSVFK